MKLTRDSWLAIGLLLILVIIMGLVAFGQQQQGKTLPALTSSSSAPNGTLALKLWLQKLNYSVIEDAPAIYKMPEAAKIVLILEPSEQLSSLELKTLDDWVRKGGTLIAASENTADIAEYYDFKMAFFDPAPAQFTLQTPLLQNPDIQASIPLKVSGVPSAVYLIPSRLSYTTYLAADSKPVLVSFTVGNGRVILASITNPFTNAGLKQDGDPALLLNLLGLAKNQGPVWFDEWHHGFHGADSTDGGGGPENWLRYTPLGRAVFFVAVVIFLALLFRGRAFGRPIPLPRELRRRGALEHVSAMANLSRLAGHRTPVLREYHTQLKRTLGRRYRLDPTLPDADYVAHLVRYNPSIDGFALLTLLNRLSQGKISEKELVEVASEAAKWIKDQ